MRLRGLAVLLLAAHSLGAAAATFVSDALSINMRVGPGNDFRINELVAAGTELQVISQDNGWTQVRTPDGERGYVLSRFLTDEPAARVQVDGMRTRVAELETTNTQLETELAAAQKGASELGQLKRKLVGANKSLESELADIKQASANALRLRADNQQFREKILSLESAVERLRHENTTLQSRRDGMKVGASILVCGVLVGLLLPLFQRRPRRGGSWDSL